MARGDLCQARRTASWRQGATSALGLGIACLTFVAGSAWGNRADPPPRAIHLPYQEVTFADPRLRIEYDQRCAADLQGMARFFRSAAAAEQWLDGRGSANGSGRQQKAGRVLVRSAVVDHRDARDALFKCLTFLEAARQTASEGNLAALDWANKLHRGSLTSIDGRIIQLLVRFEGFAF